MKSVVPIFFVLLLALPASGMAQGGFRLGDEESKSANAAIQQSVRGTLYPVILGYASTRIFKSHTLRVMGASLAIYGVIVGPSFGNFYAKDYVRGLLGMGVRMGGAFMLRDATRELLGANASEALGWDREKVTANETRIWIGTLLVAGSAAYNIITSAQSVQEFNQAQVSLRLAPLPGNMGSAPVFTARIPF